MSAAPSPERDALRKKLLATRLALGDRLERSVALQNVLRVWLVGRSERSIGAYWPIKGEFDPLPALYRWSEGGLTARRAASVGRWPIARPGNSAFTSGSPAARWNSTAYDIPKPKETDEFSPQILVVPCLGFGPGRRAAGLRRGLLTSAR